MEWEFWTILENDRGQFQECELLPLASPPFLNNGTSKVVIRDLMCVCLQHMATIWHVLPSMRERNSGIIIDIASRAATVDFPFAIGYNSSKCADARAISTLQEELDLDNLNIQTYALHPGGVYTAMAASKFQLFSAQHEGEGTRDKKLTTRPPKPNRRSNTTNVGKVSSLDTTWNGLQKFIQGRSRTLWVSFDVFPSHPCLLLRITFANTYLSLFWVCSATCAYLATGNAKELRGLYLDCRQDVDRLKAAGREKIQKETLNTLTIKFLDGYKNEPWEDKNKLNKTANREE